MMKQTCITIILLYTIASYSTPLPKDLMYKNQPLDAWVLSNLIMSDSSRFERKSLRELYIQKHIKLLTPTQENHAAKSPETDTLGYEFEEKEDGYSCYLYWKYLGTLSNSHKHIIETSWNGGGSGHFGSVIVIERHGDIIQNINELFNGDRANGAVVEASFLNDSITAKQSATPSDIFDTCLQILTADKSNNIRVIENKSGITTHIVYKNITIPCSPYDDLESSAASLAGKIITTWKNDVFETKQIILEELDEASSINSKLQQCYHSIALKMQKQSPILNQKRMAQFAIAVLDCYVNQLQK